MELTINGKPIRGLSNSQWSDAVKRAKEQVIKNRPRPQMADFVERAVGKYPAWVTWIQLSFMLVLALAAFLVSAGNELAAADLVLKGLLTVTDRVSSSWLFLALISLLIMGEIGCLSFSLAAAVTSGRSVNLFRSLSVMCAITALGANAVMTITHQVEGWAVLFQWFIALFAPLLVLGIGLHAEHLLIEYLERYRLARKRYEGALTKYAEFEADPMLDPTYMGTLSAKVLEAIIQRQAQADRADLEVLIRNNSELSEALFSREWGYATKTIAVHPTTAPVVPERTTEPDRQLGFNTLPAVAISEHRD